MRRMRTFGRLIEAHYIMHACLGEATHVSPDHADDDTFRPGVRYSFWHVGVIASAK